jgi:hypothetical protein
MMGSSLGTSVLLTTPPARHFRDGAGVPVVAAAISGTLLEVLPLARDTPSA